MKLSDNIIALLRQHKLTSSELARKVGVTKQYISNLKKLPNPNPNINIIRAIANVFNITIEQLIGDSPLPPNISESQKVLNYIPILPIREVPIWFKKPYPTPHHISIALPTVSDDYFAIYLENENAIPFFKRDCVLVFSKNKVASDKDIVLVIFDKTQNPLIKTYITDGAKHYFKSLNPEFSEIDSPKHYEIMGVLEHIQLTH